jgi:hypothetical protein
MKWIKQLSLLFALTPMSSFAFFCPKNFNQISLGDTQAQVTEQCGKPDLTETKTVEPNVPQEWIYFIPQTVGLGGPSLQQQGTLKTSISFDQSGKAINISVNGIGVGGTTICGGAQLQLGVSQDDVKNACGKPSFINKQQTESPTTSAPDKANQVVIYTYTSNPPVQLVFKEGVLVEKK